MLNISAEASDAFISSTILPLMIDGAEILLADLKNSDDERMMITLSHKSRYLPFITILYLTCVKIMKTYTI